MLLKQTVTAMAPMSFDYLFAFIADIGLEQAQCATRELNLKSV